MKQQRSNKLADLESALHLHRAGRLQEAEALYRKMPHNADALHLRGVIAHQLNRNEEAVELIGKALQAHPSNAAYYFSLDMALRALNRLDEVTACYRTLLIRAPGNALAHNRLGNALKDQGNLDEAAVCYRQAIALNADFAEAHNNLGVVYADQGRHDDAIISYRQALACDPAYAAAYANTGISLRKLGNMDDAAAAYGKAIELKPDFVVAHTSLGSVRQEQGRLDDAIASYSAALALKPDFAQVHNNLGAIFKQQDSLDEAAACYRQALTIVPDYAEAHSNLGNVLKDQNRLNEAVTCYQNALAVNPDFFEAHYNLGVVLQNLGRKVEAIHFYQSALALQPDLAEAHNNLGMLFTDEGMLEEAAYCFTKCLELMPDSVEGHYNMGNVFRGEGRISDAVNRYLTALGYKPDFAEAHNGLGLAFADAGNLAEAITCHETAIILKPDFADAHNNLGGCFSNEGKLDRAIDCYEKAIAANPALVSAYSNLGLALHGRGKPDEAIEWYRQALGLDAEFTTAHSNILFAMQYSADYAPEDVHAEHARFGAQFETPLKSSWMPHGNVRDPQRRLRIGYVSPDFNRHAVSYFIEPVLALHDKAQVEVFCYYNGTRQDPVTQRLQALAEHWIPCRHLSDERLAARIRADGIDILIDLAGHTGGNRLLAFARKPAPVQATWLGYPATTGLSAIDYRLTDVHAEPAGMTEHLNTEQLWWLPEIFCCYRAHDDSPAVIDHPPALDNGFVTFGCFNNFAKVTDPVLALWARLLQRVPHARLMLEIHGIDEPARRAEVEQRLARLGIPSERQILVPRAPANQYALYNRIDIALDPFPCNGGTTSLDTLWMGVPLVTLAGGHFTARMGVTILANAGLPELVAHSEDAYLDIAAALALDPARLARTRAGLRQRVQASPLMDAPRFTRHLEQAYRGMWHNWCESKQTAAIEGSPAFQ
ncbi:tetratricopeptide repeat protein [Noviherbaspirillum cavernae]|nr:tetratricopeptide repeat protein [Noviherbaspirillum cavernae]